MKIYNRTTKRNEDISLKNGIDNAVLQIFKSQAPVRSGTLKGQIRVVNTKIGFNIISDIYYMPYTEERWISSRWRGRANPNEAWFKEAVDLSLRFLTSVYGKGFKRE